MAYQKKRRSSFGRQSFGTKLRSQGGSRGGSRGGFRSRGPKKENIHPSKFIKAAVGVTQEEEYVAKNTFRDFRVDGLLHRNIEKKGFTIPSPIQDQAIEPALLGRDVIGIANTGTGKTLAFAIPILHKLLSSPRSKAIVMAPTRELAQQILEECNILSQGGRIFHALLIGGAPMRPQFRDLSRRPRLVIGTPGRIKDHLERETLKLDTFDMIVLDEVDRMLDMGFVHDMRTILGNVAKERQSFFFSATMDAKVRTLITEFSKDPVHVSVKTGDTCENVDQNIVHYTSSSDKIENLHSLLIQNKEGKALIFEETKRGVDVLSKALCERGFSADSIHGNKSQGQRQRALSQFKRGNTSILVATDVAARGLDVSDITHVINYSTPQSYSDYVHRIGRAGRAGKKGFALTFIQKRGR